ncbi:3047_t:CDS:1 [Acaulospora colombiana]|uniref:3047_t:CDS:1 n=1 Tax=Acaulospora colombiana TaxID=27376 RepID=A0ACA9L1V5_9GLOM|nr:3047_t:CDS:1 [Acaulospora colombiana]
METQARSKPRDIPFVKDISKLVDSMNKLSLPSDTKIAFPSISSKLSNDHEFSIKYPNSSLESSTPDKQRSVSFILHEDSDDQFELETQDDYFYDSYGVSTSPMQEKFFDTLEEYTINISGCDLSSDILVSLMDRDKEMRDLFIHNQEYFDLVKQSIFGISEEGWQQFLKILYSPRRILLDSEWMSIISETLNPNPPLLVKFKEIVGYCEVDDEIASTGNAEEDDDSSFSYSSPSHSLNSCIVGHVDPGENLLDVSVIRDYPKALERLETTYPQFFINVNQFLSQQTEYRGSALGGNHLSQTRRSGRSGNNVLQERGTNDSELSSSWRRYFPVASSPLKSANSPLKTPTLYDEFKSVLLSSRSEMSDEEWEMAIYEYLDPWPQLAAQFGEIISYEVAEG